MGGGGGCCGEQGTHNVRNSSRKFNRRNLDGGKLGEELGRSFGSIKTSCIAVEDTEAEEEGSGGSQLDHLDYYQTTLYCQQSN